MHDVVATTDVGGVVAGSEVDSVVGVGLLLGRPGLDKRIEGVIAIEHRRRQRAVLLVVVKDVASGGVRVGRHDAMRLPLASKGVRYDKRARTGADDWVFVIKGALETASLPVRSFGA